MIGDDETMINPILRSGRRIEPYKCGLNTKIMINPATGKTMTVRGDITETTVDEKLCNNLMTWHNVASDDPDEMTEKMLNRIYKPVNGGRNQQMYNRERNLVRRDLEMSRRSFSDLLASREAKRQREFDSRIRVEPYRFPYDSTNNVSMYKMFRAIRNLELENDALRSAIIKSDEIEKRIKLDVYEEDGTAMIEFHEKTMLKGSFTVNDEPIEFEKQFVTVDSKSINDETYFQSTPLEGVNASYSIVWNPDTGKMYMYDENGNHYNVTITNAEWRDIRIAYDDQTFFSSKAMQQFMTQYDIGRLSEFDERIKNVYTKYEADAKFANVNHDHPGLVNKGEVSDTLFLTQSCDVLDDHHIPSTQAVDDKYVHTIESSNDLITCACATTTDDNITTEHKNHVIVTMTLNPTFDIVTAHGIDVTVDENGGGNNNGAITAAGNINSSANITADGTLSGDVLLVGDISDQTAPGTGAIVASGNVKAHNIYPVNSVYMTTNQEATNVTVANETGVGQWVSIGKITTTSTVTTGDTTNETDVYLFKRVE